ncbi:autotransporter domain-containing protein [Alkalispirochaeta sphaeroplastigenens]|uniref:autotransporter domain-containing protein n=1 Tax=Alkalispirochaeta sphaeroplastigenens TaxID=1187066 RepID=UPI0011AF3F7F|nr:autotransporter domain-containing protein [Alkalispirochaeta sphaeroplastigenens]
MTGHTTGASRKGRGSFPGLPAFLLLALLFLPSLIAASPQDATGEVGFSVGRWFPGDIKLDDENLEARSTVLLRGYLDMYVFSQLSVGMYVAATWGELREAGEADYKGNSFDTTEFGGALKARYFLTETFSLRPGLQFGYRRITIDEVSDDPRGVALNGTLEAQYHFPSGAIPYVDLGFMSQPFGGNRQWDLTWGPRFYLALGIGHTF